MVLFPTLFLVARIKVVLSSIIQSWIVFNVSEFGLALNGWINVLMIC